MSKTFLDLVTAASIAKDNLAYVNQGTIDKTASYDTVAKFILQLSDQGFKQVNISSDTAVSDITNQQVLYHVDSNSGDRTLSLPLSGSMPAGAKVIVTNFVGSHNVTITYQSGVTVTIPQNGYVLFVWDTDKWFQMYIRRNYTQQFDNGMNSGNPISLGFMTAFGVLSPYGKKSAMESYKQEGSVVVAAGVSASAGSVNISNYCNGYVFVSYKNSSDNNIYIAVVNVGRLNRQFMYRKNYTVTTYQNQEIVMLDSTKTVCVLYNNLSGDIYSGYIGLISISSTTGDITLGSMVSMGNYGTRPSVILIDTSKVLSGFYNSNTYTYTFALWNSGSTPIAKLGSDLGITVASDADNSFAFCRVSASKAVIAYVSGASIILRCVNVSGNTPSLLGSACTWSIDGKGLNGLKSMKYIGNVNSVDQIIIGSSINGDGSIILQKFDVTGDTPAAIGSQTAFTMVSSSVISLDMVDWMTLNVHFAYGGNGGNVKMFNLLPDTIVEKLYTAYAICGSSEKPMVSILPNDIIALARFKNVNIGIEVEFIRTYPFFGEGILGFATGNGTTYEIVFPEKGAVSGSCFTGLTKDVNYYLNLFGELITRARNFSDPYYIFVMGDVDNFWVGRALSTTDMRFVMQKTYK